MKKSATPRGVVREAGAAQRPEPGASRAAARGNPRRPLQGSREEGDGSALGAGPRTPATSARTPQNCRSFSSVFPT